MRYLVALFFIVLISMQIVHAENSITSTLRNFNSDYDNNPYYIVYGSNQDYHDFQAAAIISSEMAKIIDNYGTFPRIVSDTEILSYYQDNNLILIGGPCSNRISELLLESQGITCSDWRLPKGASLIKRVENANNAAIIISGSEASDTLRAARTLKNFERSGKLASSDEITYHSHMSISEAIEHIIDRYNVNDDLLIVPSNLGETSDFPAALRLAGIIHSNTDKKIDGFPNIQTPDRVQQLSNNIILVGGPCANKLTESIINDKGYNCHDWKFNENEAIIRLFEHEGNVILLLAGTSSDPAQTMELIDMVGEHYSYPELQDSSLVVVSEQKIRILDDKKNIIEQGCSGPLCWIRQLFMGEIASRVSIDKSNIDYVRFMDNQYPNKNCYTCFMEAQSKDYVSHIMSFLSNKNYDNFFSEGEKRYILGKITENRDLTCTAINYYIKHLDSDLSYEDQLMVYENIFFVSTECLSDRKQYYYLTKVLDLSDKLGYSWKTNIYSQILHTGVIDINPQKVKIERSLSVPRGSTKLDLGRSYFVINEEDTLGVQVDRITRDWLSLDIDLFPNEAPDFVTNGISYMEGEVVGKIARSSNPTIIPYSNTLIVSQSSWIGTKWYAMDDEGIFRFEVLRDKVQYPTTKCIKNVCLLVDTHGISSLVSQAIHHNTTVVIGCGDYYDKMEAAYYLALKGINTYYPCDRFSSEMIGYKADGMALGSAPVRKVGNHTVVGNQTITISLDETIVVQNTRLSYPLQYYDAPYKYFTTLSKLSGVRFRFVVVDVTGIGEAYKVIDRARQIGAKVIAVRVAYSEDYQSVKEWLMESPNHRAVLHHTACYPHGLRILDEFPEQTTFGDPHPVFY